MHQPAPLRRCCHRLRCPAARARRRSRANDRNGRRRAAPVEFLAGAWLLVAINEQMLERNFFLGEEMPMCSGKHLAEFYEGTRP